MAAPTTSLPEEIGGARNWDYRYCWLRDATFTLYALVHGGYEQEAQAWRDWLLRAVAGDAGTIQVLYGLAGERASWRRTADWLPGFADSRPVRLGNAAAGQLQLDIFGELFDVLHVARRSGLTPSDEAWSMQRHLIEFLADAWQQPDSGIWEIAQRAAAASPIHGDGLGGSRSSHQVGRGFGLEGPLDRVAAAARRDPRRGLPPRLRRRAGHVHRGPTARARWTPASCSSRWSASCRRTTRAFAAPSRPSRSDLMQDGFLRRYDTDAPDADGLTAVRAPSCPAPSGWPTPTSKVAAKPRPGRSSSGCWGCATTWACWRRNTTPWPGGCWATSPRRSRTSPWSTAPRTCPSLAEAPPATAPHRPCAGVTPLSTPRASRRRGATLRRVGRCLEPCRPHRWVVQPRCRQASPACRRCRRGTSPHRHC